MFVRWVAGAWVARRILGAINETLSRVEPE